MNSVYYSIIIVDGKLYFVNKAMKQVLSQQGTVSLCLVNGEHVFSQLSFINFDKCCIREKHAMLRGTHGSISALPLFYSFTYKITL